MREVETWKLGSRDEGKGDVVMRVDDIKRDLGLKSHEPWLERWML